MFRLTRNFSIASFLGIALVAGTLGFIYWDWSYETLKARETEANVNLTRALSNDLWSRYAEFISNASTLSREELQTHPRNAQLRNELIHKLRGLRVAKVKIYNLDGLTVFSTEAGQIGESKQDNAGFQLARAGGVASEITYRNQFSHYDQIIENRNVLSSYIPLRRSESSPVEGVFEVYSDVTVFVEEIEQARYRVFGIVAGLLTLLYLFLLVYIRKADALIQSFRRAELRNARFYDPGTGLPNRYGFEHLLERAVEDTRRDNATLSVIVFNVDRFKVVNEGLDYDSGNMVLTEMGKRLQQCLNQEDVVARLGSDEFGIIVKNRTSIDRIMVLANRLTKLISEPISIGEQDIVVTTSGGIALFPYDTREHGKLIPFAAAAMHKAKTAGGNRCMFYTDGMNIGAARRFELEMGLREAVKQNKFELHYQPRVGIGERRVTGMEALLRWNSPHGPVSPEEFIPILEDTGMIAEVTREILRRACEQCREWHLAGHTDLRVSVNLSASQFHDASLVDQIRAALKQSGLHPNALELEITESVLIENTDHAITCLGALKFLGVRASIDDFGTGYSALSYLMHFPVDYVKIDRSFVKDITSNPDHANLTRAIIAMAKSLGLGTVAEGVENEEQLQFLIDEGCTEVQGMLLSEPVGVEQFFQRVEDINSRWSMAPV